MKNFLRFVLTLAACSIVASCTAQEATVETSRESSSQSSDEPVITTDFTNSTPEVYSTEEQTSADVSVTTAEVHVEKDEVITTTPVTPEEPITKPEIINKFKGITTDVVNFRSSPSIEEDNIITTLKPSTEIYVTNLDNANGFLSAMLLDETPGFLSKDYVKVNSAEFFDKENNTSLTLYYNENNEFVNEKGVVQSISENLISKEEYLNFIKNSCDKELVSTFSTNYSLEEIYAGKAFNINRACEEVSVVIPAGTDFNWHEIVGNTNYNEGYALANVYAGGKVVKGYGGGVCQVSTTIYGCVRDLDLAVKERHQHGLPVTYVDWYNDEDASVGDIGEFNFIFTNNKDYDILIEAYTSTDETKEIKEQGVLTVNFYKLIY